MRVERVTAAEVRPLRGAVLRPGQPMGASVYPWDDAQDTWHLAAFDDDGRLVSTGTFFPEDLDGQPAWRLRGMATEPDARSAGWGAAILQTGIEVIRSRGGHLLWCNARVPALAFYQRHGFTTVGDVFETAIGIPHMVAVLDLNAEPASENDQAPNP